MNATAQSHNSAEILQLVPVSDAPSLFPIKVTAALLPETLALLTQAPAMLQSAETITISTDADLETAADQLQRIKGIAKSINTQRMEITKPLDDAKAQVMAYVKGPMDQLASAETLLKAGMLTYTEEQDKKRRHEEAKAAEETRRAQEKLELKADKLEERGKTEQADAVREEAAMQIAAPSAVVSSPKLAGISSRKDYSAEVTDLMTLCKSVAAQSLLAECQYDPAKLLAIVQGYAAANTPILTITANDKFLSTQAKAFKEAFNYPGCRLVTKSAIASRSK